MKRKRDQEVIAKSEDKEAFDLQKIFQAPDTSENVNLYNYNNIQGAIANPYLFRGWWNSIQAIPISKYEERAILYQRALHYIPGSYKLWFNLLNESKKYFKAN